MPALIPGHASMVSMRECSQQSAVIITATKLPWRHSSTKGNKLHAQKSSNPDHINPRLGSAAYSQGSTCGTLSRLYLASFTWVAHSENRLLTLRLIPPTPQPLSTPARPAPEIPRPVGLLLAADLRSPSLWPPNRSCKPSKLTRATHLGTVRTCPSSQGAKSIMYITRSHYQIFKENHEKSPMAFLPLMFHVTELHLLGRCPGVDEEDIP